MAYMPQLDGLRAVAILFVLVQHFSPRFSFFGSEGVFPVGFVGVDLFFVLSGFLITGILLRTRAPDTPLPQKVKRFFFRRALRLFPIYYLFLLVATFFNYYGIRDFAGWMYSYTSNFLAVVENEPTWGYTQFWSLAVEEQFYLVWPWVVLLIPEKHLLKAFVLIFLSGPLTRLSFVLAGGDDSDIMVRFATFCLFDLFGAGAVLAFVHWKGVAPKTEGLIRKAFWVGISTVALVLLARLSKLPVISTNSFILVPFSFVSALIFARVIHAAALGRSTWLGKLLETTPMVHVGRISYGIYVYHIVIEELTPRLFDRVGISYPESFPIQFVLLTAITLLVAHLSWTLIEKPINNLKRYT